MAHVPWCNPVIGLAVVLLHVSGVPCAAEEESADGWTTPYRFGGCGGVYLLASPGELWVDIEKADLNKYGRRTHLRAILFGPDRCVLDEQWLPDDGRAKGSGMGPVQRVRLTAQVERRGVYGVNITVTQDRYGDAVSWGFRTNCPHYLIETSRGHRDARHEEPLVLRNPDAQGDVCFVPSRGKFQVQATGLWPGAVTVYDAQGAEAGVLEPSDKGVAEGTFNAPAGEGTGPWRLHLPAFSGTVNIDGVTRWRKGQLFDNLSLWTPQLDSWFPFLENRWLLTPYSRTIYIGGESEISATFQVRNCGPVETDVALSIEFREGEVLEGTLSQENVRLAPGKSALVSALFSVSAVEDGRECYLRATPAAYPGFSTYSTILLKPGRAPAERPLDIPLVLKPYRHENEQFGYLPAYPLTNEIYFDVENRPVVSSDDGVSVLRDDGFTETLASSTGDGEAPFGPRISKVAFDADNDMYLIAQVKGAAALLHSRDKGRTFAPARIPRGRTFDIEQFSGHNAPEGPPPFVGITMTAKDPELMWRALNDLELFVPEKAADGTISVGSPTLVSKKCIGLSSHSGIPSTIVSRGSKVHVAWGEATEPDTKAPGVPTYVATYDRDTGALGQPALVGHGPPANDVHNTPCITMDSKGYLHVLVGTHGRTFKYARSLAPNDAAGGWTDAEDIGAGLRQTYVGLVCDKDDVLHLVFRLWQYDKKYFPASHYACLAYMSKRPGGTWSEPCPLVVAPFSEYSIFYHRLTIDREGHLYLSYDYWSTFWFYRTDHWGSRRALMTSPDGGATWQLAGMDDLTP